MSSGYTEDELVEQPAIEEFQKLGWDYVNAYQEVLATPDSSGTLGRETCDEVVLSSVLSEKLNEYNPDIPAEQIDVAIKELSRDRSAMNISTKSFSRFMKMQCLTNSRRRNWSGSSAKSTT